MRMEHIALVGLGLLVASRLTRVADITAGPSPPSPAFQIVSNIVTPKIPVAEATIVATRPADWPATFDAFLNRHKDIRMQYLDPITNQIDAYLNKIAYIRKYPGDKGAEALSYYSYQLDLARADYESTRSLLKAEYGY